MKRPKKKKERQFISWKKTKEEIFSIDQAKIKYSWGFIPYKTLKYGTTVNLIY